VDETGFGKEKQSDVGAASEQHREEIIGLVQIIAAQVSLEADLKRRRVDGTLIEEARRWKIHAALTAIVLPFKASEGMSGCMLLDSNQNLGETHS